MVFIWAPGLFMFLSFGPLPGSILSPGVCRNIALLSLKSVSESANDEVLLQRRRPVKNGRVIFQKALPWLQHQKLVSIFSDGILIHRGIWNQSGGE